MSEDTKPYEDIILTSNEKERTFEENVSDGELLWHRDREDRIIEVLEGDDWKLQMDNELPVILEKSKKYFIPKGVYHRAIKGKDKLKIKIQF
jgi:hypothetical protein